MSGRRHALDGSLTHTTYSHFIDTYIYLTARMADTRSPRRE